MSTNVYHHVNQMAVRNSTNCAERACISNNQTLFVVVLNKQKMKCSEKMRVIWKRVETTDGEYTYTAFKLI